MDQIDINLARIATALSLKDRSAFGFRKSEAPDRAQNEELLILHAQSDDANNEVGVGASSEKKSAFGFGAAAQDDSSLSEQQLVVHSDGLDAVNQESALLLGADIVATSQSQSESIDPGGPSAGETVSSTLKGPSGSKVGGNANKPIRYVSEGGAAPQRTSADPPQGLGRRGRGDGLDDSDTKQNDLPTNRSLVDPSQLTLWRRVKRLLGFR